MKKEFSDHITKVFFRQEPKKKERNFFAYIALSLGIVVFVILVTNLFYIQNGHSQQTLSALGQHIIFEKHDGPYALEFDFVHSPSKVGVLSVDLPKVNLEEYNELRFSVRLDSRSANQLGLLKVILENKRKEKSEIYVSDIKNKWKDMTLSLSDFANIYDKSEINKLSFVLEEWNLYPKIGRILIEDIQFSKKN